MLAALGGLLVCPVIGAQPAARIIADGSFHDSLWSVSVATATGGASQTVQRQLSGGNPGAFRAITHILPPVTGSATAVIVVHHVFQGNFYIPAFDGAIDHIDYAEDGILPNLSWPDGAPAHGDSPPFALRCGVVTISRLVRTYGDAPPGVPVALVGSAGWLEIAVREGNAAHRLGLHRGDPVMVALDGGARS